jgi:hypothetical protein
MSRGLLEAWWDRNVQQRRAALVKQTPLPHDGASWVMMVNFFAVVGMADARIRVTSIDPFKLMDKMLEIWPRRETWFSATKKSETII